jgi:hypothetical protein
MMEEQSRNGDQAEAAENRYTIDHLQPVSCFVTSYIDMSDVWYASHCII